MSLAREIPSPTDTDQEQRATEVLLAIKEAGLGFCAACELVGIVWGIMHRLAEQIDESEHALGHFRDGQTRGRELADE